MTFRSEKFRSKRYLQSVRGEPCLSCGAPPPSHAHHLRHSENRGFGQKVADNFTVPLCGVCHGECHTRGAESEWWALRGIDSIDWAKRNFKEWEGDNASEGCGN